MQVSQPQALAKKDGAAKGLSIKIGGVSLKPPKQEAVSIDSSVVVFRYDLCLDPALPTCASDSC